MGDTVRLVEQIKYLIEYRRSKGDADEKLALFVNGVARYKLAHSAYFQSEFVDGSRRETLFGYPVYVVHDDSTTPCFWIGEKQLLQMEVKRNG